MKRDFNDIRTTIGKLYKVKKIHYGKLQIVDDKDTEHYFPINNKWFISIKKFRKQKLDKLNSL